MKHAGILARRYAKALFLVGTERNILDKLRKDISLFAQTLQNNTEFYHFFVSPEVSRKEKEKKIEEIFGDVLSAIFYNFLLVLLQKGRQNIFLEVAKAFDVQLDEYHNRVNAQVISAVELAPEMKKDIQEKIAIQLKKEVLLDSKIDESLLGGLQIRIDGKVIDGSIKGQLQRMRQLLLKQTSEKLN